MSAVLGAHLQPFVDAQVISTFVDTVRTELDMDWQDPARRLVIAPGEETDPELQELLMRATSLSRSGSSVSQGVNTIAALS